VPTAAKHRCGLGLGDAARTMSVARLGRFYSRRSLRSIGFMVVNKMIRLWSKRVRLNSSLPREPKPSAEGLDGNNHRTGSQQVRPKGQGRAREPHFSMRQPRWLMTIQPKKTGIRAGSRASSAGASLNLQTPAITISTSPERPSAHPPAQLTPQGRMRSTPCQLARPCSSSPFSPRIGAPARAKAAK
jgi:hypothetical protein